MTALDKLRETYGDCVAGSILLTREEYDRCGTAEALTALMQAKAKNATGSLIAAAHERWATTAVLR